MDNTFDFNSVGKRMPYTVPDGFFDTIEENVMQEVAAKKEKANPGKNRKKVVTIAIRSLLATAAAVALFFVVRAVIPKADTTPVDDFASVELAFNNLSNDDQDFLLALYEEDEYIEELQQDQEL
ncbi:MAG: hypothetical protein IKX39_01250 [Muribaculaceae bacterium]|nr:hypothetical protein [Muribaculaceae bacterium]